MLSRASWRSKPIVAALVMVLAVSACTPGGSDDQASDLPPVVTTPDEAGGGPAADDGGGDGGGPGSPGGGTGPTSGGTPTTRSGGGTPTTARARTTTTTDPAAAIRAAARSGPGGFARTVLRPQPATRIVVEVLVEPGADPNRATLDHLAQVLRDASGKAVTMAGPTAVPAGDGTVDDEEIRALSDRHGRVQQGADGQAVFRLLFLRGSYAPDHSVLGIAVRGDTAAVFRDQVRRAAGPLGSTAVLEDAVTTHEVGHLLGLVDLALDTGRDDPSHPGHSRNRHSVMYWAVESDVVSQVLDGPPPRDFDEADRDDLAALRSGA